MGLVRHITKQEEIPHEEGQHMTFRALNWVQRDAAKAARGKAQIADLRDMGAEVMQMFMGLRTEGADTAAALTDPFATYDKRTLLHTGIVGWSYGEPVTPENIDDLDEPTTLWAARRILDLAGVGDDPLARSSS